MRRDAQCPTGHFLDVSNGAEPKFYDGQWHVKMVMVYVTEEFAEEKSGRKGFLKTGGWWRMCPKCAYKYHQEGIKDDWKRITWEEHQRNKLQIRNIELRPLWSPEFIMKAE